MRPGEGQVINWLCFVLEVKNQWTAVHHCEVKQPLSALPVLL